MNPHPTELARRAIELAHPQGRNTVCNMTAKQYIELAYSPPTGLESSIAIVIECHQMKNRTPIQDLIFEAMKRCYPRVTGSRETLFGLYSLFQAPWPAGVQVHNNYNNANAASFYLSYTVPDSEPVAGKFRPTLGVTPEFSVTRNSFTWRRVDVPFPELIRNIRQWATEAAQTSLAPLVPSSSL